MTRPLRLEFPGAIYHITSRGNARDDIFIDTKDRELFLSVLAGTIARYNWLCHGYCLMGNHYHLLIETVDPTLSLGMRQLNGVYTQSFNRIHQRVGHIFQGRYKSILVEKDAHLLELSRYIVLNPVKANMVKRPAQWAWSSFKATAGLIQVPEFLCVTWILGNFASTESAAKQEFIKFVQDGLKEKKESPWQRLKGHVFGSAKFVSEIQDKLEEKQEIKEIPSQQRYPGRPSLEELFREVNSKQERNLKIKNAHCDYGYKMQQIAVALGVHYTTVSRAIRM